MKTDDFVTRLSKLDRGQLAGLRNGINHVPGEHIPSMRVVEPFISEKNQYARTPLYIFAGMFSHIWRPIEDGVAWDDLDTKVSFASALKIYLSQNKSKEVYIERMMGIILEMNIDGVINYLLPLLEIMNKDGVSWSWRRLAKDLMNWDHPNKFVQLNLARDFYG